MALHILGCRLYTLCQLGNLEYIQWLLSQIDVDVNYSNAWGDTLLSAAYRHGHWHIMEYLMRHKTFDADLHPLWLLLINAADNGYAEAVKLLSPWCTARDHSEALVVACRSGCQDVVNWLIGNSMADASYRSSCIGLTPLSAAIRRNNWQIAKYLALNTSAELTSNEAKNYLTMATVEGCVEKVSLLSRYCDSFTLNECLILACRQGHYNIVTWLINNTVADVRYKNNLGLSAPIQALQLGHWPIVNFFVSIKVIDLSLSSTWKSFIACINNKLSYHISMPESVLIFLLYQCPRKQLQEAFYDACLEGNLIVIDWFLTNYASIDVNEDLFGKTALFVAFEAEQWEVVKYITELSSFEPSKHNFEEMLVRADINDTLDGFHLVFPRFSNEDEVNRLLYFVSKRGSFNAVKWLLANTRASVNYDCSVSRSSTTFFDLLFNVVDTPVTIACAQKHWNVVRLLVQHPRFDASHHDVDKLLEKAVREEEIEGVRLLSVYCDQEDIDNALLASCLFDHLDICQWLVQHANADVNCRMDWTGDTPLIVACQEDNWNIVRFLVNCPQIDRDQHEICAYIFEAASEGRLDDESLEKAYNCAKTLHYLYESDDGEELWESWSDPEQ